MEPEQPLLITLNSLRHVLSHFSMRGIKHISGEDLATLETAAAFFRQCNASHFAQHIEHFLRSRENDPVDAARQLLELQSRVILFERVYSRQSAIALLS